MKRTYTAEYFNGLSHLIGAVAAFVGLVLLVQSAWLDDSSLKLFAFAVFGLSGIIVYAASAAYHLSVAGPEVTRFLKRLDHIGIYLFIAGSYTPVCLVPLRDSFGVELCIGVWTFAAIGVLKKLFWITAPKWFSTIMYSLIAAISVFAFPQMYKVMPLGSFVFAVAGLLFYAVGMLVYLFEKPDPIPYKFGHHEIWHCFVMAASLCHFLMVYLYL